MEQRKRGRPRKPDATTNAQRVAAYKAQRIYIKLGPMAETVRKMADHFEISFDDAMRSLVQYALCNRNWWQTGFPLLDVEPGTVSDKQSEE